MPLPAQGSIGADLSRLRAACPEALLAGADGWYSAISGLLPELIMPLVRAARAGDRRKTMQIEAPFAPLWALFQQHGSLRVIYTAANLLGLATCQPPRPILPLGKQATDQVAAALAGLGLS